MQSKVIPMVIQGTKAEVIKQFDRTKLVLLYFPVENKITFN